MIEVTGVNKMFGEIKALDNIVATIQEGSIFGLIGTNGAGKSTLLRLACGVFKPDDGLAIVDNMPVYDNVHAKAKLFFIADEPYFFNGATQDQHLFQRDEKAASDSAGAERKDGVPSV